MCVFVCVCASQVPEPDRLGPPPWVSVTRAHVLGCVRPGVPAWRCGPASRAPGLAYVVFPGNVGAPDDLAAAAALLGAE